MTQDKAMLKKMEINSAIICELANNKAPMWVRPAMIWEDRWDGPDYTVERAIKEAVEKIKIFVPLCAEHIHSDRHENIFRRAV